MSGLQHKYADFTHFLFLLAGYLILDAPADIFESKKVTLLLKVGTGHLKSLGRPLSNFHLLCR